MDKAVAKVGDTAVMSNNHDRTILLMGQFAQQLQYGAAGVRIKGGSRLVGQQNLRTAGERSSQSHALLLAST
jgi:hypothetical protein